MVVRSFVRSSAIAKGYTHTAILLTPKLQTAAAFTHSSFAEGRQKPLLTLVPSFGSRL